MITAASLSHSKMETAVDKARLDKSKLLQYVGVSVVAGAREYSFKAVHPPEPERFFTVIIESADFLLRRLKIQEGPGLCYRMLNDLLAVEQKDSPLRLRQQVTASDLATYAEAVSAKANKWSDERRAEARQRLHDRLR